METTKTETLVETLNALREETIAPHYGAAVAELKEAVKNNPLQTHFNIYSGCISQEITDEIAYRLTNTDGVKAISSTYGIFRTGYYLSVEVVLPQQLVHPEEKPVSTEETLPEITLPEITPKQEEQPTTSA